MYGIVMDWKSYCVQFLLAVACSACLTSSAVVCRLIALVGQHGWGGVASAGGEWAGNAVADRPVGRCGERDRRKSVNEGARAGSVKRD